MQVERSPAPLHKKVRKIGEILHKHVVAGLVVKKASSLQAQQAQPPSVLSNSTSVYPNSVATVAVTTCPAPLSLLQHFRSQAPLREDKSWRCDLHPAWSRDHTLVAINGRPGGAERQVVLLNLGDDLSKYFPLEP